MITLITLQTFDGSWDMSKHLTDILGHNTATLTHACPNSVSTCIVVPLNKHTYI